MPHFKVVKVQPASGITLCVGPPITLGNLVTNRLGRSLDGQELGATGAAARATEVASITGGRPHRDVEASGSRNHDRELRTVRCAPWW
jgi:hypothetical protein